MRALWLVFRPLWCLVGGALALGFVLLHRLLIVVPLCTYLAVRETLGTVRAWWELRPGAASIRELHTWRRLPITEPSSVGGWTRHGLRLPRLLLEGAKRGWLLPFQPE